MRKNTKFFYLVVILFDFMLSPNWALSSHAINPGANDTSQAISLEQVNKIARQLMAPCCWSTTADAHQSPAAEKIKAQIRTALQRGDVEQKILDSFVAAYGERILAKPKAVGFNLMAWILPALAILFGGIAAWKFLRHASQPPAKLEPAKPAPGDDPYAQRLERELEAMDK